MSKKRIGIIDYGVGNVASITATLKKLGFHVAVSGDKKILEDTDLLSLPGVGAFPAAMKSLKENDLIRFLQSQAETGKPLIGICLGMQLLAESSDEVDYCEGLGLIPGKVSAFENRQCHVGWNSLTPINQSACFTACAGKEFYFNHTYFYEGPSVYKACLTKFSTTYASVIKKDNIVGIQFHPEKSQQAGKDFLNNVIKELLYG